MQRLKKSSIPRKFPKIRRLKQQSLPNNHYEIKIPNPICRGTCVRLFQATDKRNCCDQPRQRIKRQLRSHHRSVTPPPAQQPPRVRRRLLERQRPAERRLEHRQPSSPAGRSGTGSKHTPGSKPGTHPPAAGAQRSLHPDREGRRSRQRRASPPWQFRADARSEEAAGKVYRPFATAANGAAKAEKG